MATYFHPKVKSRAGKRLCRQLKKMGFPNHRIGALFDENHGRVAEAIGKRRKK